MTPAFCPHCGSDIKMDEPIILNDFSMYGDGYPLCYQGEAIKMTPGQRAVCWSLLKAFPRTVTRDALLLRSGSDSESNCIEVMVSRIRAALKARGIANPIESVWGQGYRWTVAPTGARVNSRGGGRPHGPYPKIVAV